MPDANTVHRGGSARPDRDRPGPGRHNGGRCSGLPRSRRRGGVRVADDHGNCKGPPPDCRRIVIRLRYGVKSRCAGRTTSTGQRCLVNVHANRLLTPTLWRIGRQQSVRWGEGRRPKITAGAGQRRAQMRATIRGHRGTACDPRAIASGRPRSRTASHGHSTATGMEALGRHLRWSEH